MKIFQISTFYHPITGGVESHVATLSKFLVEYGHEVTVLASDSSKVGPRIAQKQGMFEGIPIVRFLTWFSISQYHKFYPGLLRLPVGVTQGAHLIQEGLDHLASQYTAFRW